ncbi:interferon alpha-inducible protein 27-like protein 2A [Alexandromys fortis]|uniref:interferon alpha-inducible protein 27-like protein 2A n=1 Tax=Alexandromys fortis TaxID=100897 RepID=UPI0021535F71|nr:interferon alpha-inducible protein 27-like protein 2A [Microtus fortis]
MVLSGTGMMVASLVSRITISAAVVKAGGTVSGTIPAGLQAMTIGAVPSVLGAVGFTGTGIAASSLAAKMMSLSAIANGGGVFHPISQLLSFVSSTGAAGLSLSSKFLLCSAGSALTASECSSPSLL